MWEVNLEPRNQHKLSLNPNPFPFFNPHRDDPNVKGVENKAPNPRVATTSRGRDSKTVLKKEGFTTSSAASYNRKMDRFGDLLGEDDEKDENDIEMSSAPANNYAKLFEETNAIKTDISKIR